MTTHRLQRRRTALIAVSLAATSVLTPLPTHAAPTTWISSTGGDFSDAANWSGGVPSSVNSPAIFSANPASNRTVTLSRAGSSFSALTTSHPDLTFDLGGIPIQISTVEVAGEPNSTAAGYTITNSSQVDASLSSTNVHIGRDANTTGSVSLTGGTAWSTPGTGVFYVGDAGAGSLLITGNSLLTSSSNTSAVIGRQSTSNGSVTVAGLGSSWVLSPSLTLAPSSNSTASLSVIDGALVSADSLRAGRSSGVPSSSSIVVTGANSRLYVRTDLTLGSVTTLNVGSGAVLSVGRISIGTDSSLIVSPGGTITSSTEEFFRTTINFGGSLSYSGPGTLTSNTITNNGTLAGPKTPGDFLNIVGQVYGAGSFAGRIEFSGGLHATVDDVTALPTTLTLQDTFFSASSRLSLVVFSGATSSHLAFGGPVSLGGTLSITRSGFPLVLNQSFDLFDFNFSPPTGRFLSIQLPTPPAGLSWDTSNLYTTGTITIVPEPLLPILSVVLAPIILRRSR